MLDLCPTAISAGAVYVYRLGSSSGKWREKQKINVPATAEGYEMFGTSIAIWEDKMLIGSTGGNIEGMLQVMMHCRDLIVHRFKDRKCLGL